MSNLIINPFISFPAAGDGSYLNGVSGIGACMDLDATIAASYGGSGQTWSNLINTPTVGVKADYDFYLGKTVSASTDDPTFTGSAGSSSAYFLHDGGDYFTAINTGANVGILSNIHKTTTSGWWIGFAGRFGSTNSTSTILGNAGITADRGFSLQYTTATANDSIDFKIFNTLATITKTLKSGSDFIDISQDFLILVSGDNTITTNNIKMWLYANGSAYTEDNSSQTWNAQTSDIGTGENCGIASTFRQDNNNGVSIVGNNTRTRWAGAGNVFINSTNAAAILAHIEARHGINYG
jgi:hypothetical protein